MFGKKKPLINSLSVAKTQSIAGDLECENAIIEDKARFGRTRTALMRYLRSKYGDQVANRAMWRVNHRFELGYMVGDDKKEAEDKALKSANRLRPIGDLVKDKREDERFQNTL